MFVVTFFASFFRNIGFADQLGSGVRNLFKYSKFYSGQEPEFIEGDVFRIIVPLDDEYSYDYDISATSATEIQLSEDEEVVLRIIAHNPFVTQKEIHVESGISLGTVKRILPRLQEKGVLARKGNKRSGEWLLSEVTKNKFQ